jgi:hypothetical protein
MKDIIFITDTSRSFIRAVVYEIDEDGRKSVKDIMEADSAGRIASMLAATYNEDNSVFADDHKDVDFGRAKLFKSKIIKIVEDVVA